MLAALSPATLARACASRSATSTKAQVRAIAAEHELPVAVQARLAGPVLPGRHRRARRSWPATAAWASARATRRRRRRVGGPPPRRASVHRRPAPRPRRRRHARAALRAADRRGRQHRRPSGRAPRWPRRASRVRDARLHAPASEVRRASSCATARPRCRARCAATTIEPARARRRPPPRARPRSSCAATPCWDAPQSLP